MPPTSTNPRAKRINLLMLAVVIVLLGVEVARSVGGLRDELRREPSAPGSNQVAPELLAPRLLDDHDDLTSFLDDFAKDRHRVFAVKGQGSFYLDDERDAIKDEIRLGRMWKPLLVKTLNQRIRPASTVVDVGAHNGALTMVMARGVGEQGRVYAFEPRRRPYRELYHNLQLNHLSNVVPLRFAVGQEAAVITLPSPAQGEQVELRSLDSFGFHDLSLIRIDADGAEDGVLEGARKTIARERPTLLVEIRSEADFNTALPELRAKIVRTIQSMEQMGYLVTRLGVADYLATPRGTP